MDLLEMLKYIFPATGNKDRLVARITLPVGNLHTENFFFQVSSMHVLMYICSIAACSRPGNILHINK